MRICAANNDKCGANNDKVNLEVLYFPRSVSVQSEPEVGGFVIERKVFFFLLRLNGVAN